MEQQSQYISDGKSKFIITPEQTCEFTLALRMPEWCDQADVTVDGVSKTYFAGDKNGYIVLAREWKTGDEVEISFSMPVQIMKSHPQVRQTFSKVALQRGPFVYCMEQVDNGKALYQLQLPRKTEFTISEQVGSPGGVKVIQAAGQRMKPTEEWADELYRSDSRWRMEQVNLKFIPYFTWANRGVGEMTVWIQEASEE